jgi:hypothetical protein
VNLPLFLSGYANFVRLLIAMFSLSVSADRGAAGSHLADAGRRNKFLISESVVSIDRSGQQRNLNYF